MEFIFAFLYRIYSGEQNAAGYAKNNNKRIFQSCLLFMMNASLIVDTFYNNIPATYEWATVAFALVGAIGVFGVEGSFNKQINLLPADVHLYETIATGATMIALCTSNYNILLILCSIYPALIIHKAIINDAFDLPFFDQRTDDKSGKFFGIPLLGIKVPRLPNSFRIPLAIASLIAAYFVYTKGMELKLHPFITLRL